MTLSEHYSGRVAAMVSGGIDSMVMLHLLSAAGTDLFVVHVNHGIRAESGRDSDFVRDYCKARGIRFEAYDFDVPTLAKLNKRSEETEARIARQNVAKELLLSGKADLIAVAHNANDNAETVLMHLLRGSGLDGLRGIRQTDRIVRPLLEFTRESIEEYARENNIPYVTDKTNFDSAYTRNFVRLELLPLIKTRYPGAVEALNRLAKGAEETADALDKLLDRSLISKTGDTVKLSLDALASPLASRYVLTAAKMLMPVDVTRSQVQSVLALTKTGAKAELAGGLKAYREYTHITFCFDKESPSLVVPFSLGTVKFGPYSVTTEVVAPRPIVGKTVLAAPLPNGCVFRTRKEGDSFTPFGGKRKSLKKYLIDKKIPSRLRDSLICLADGSEIIAIVGVEISDKFRITASTQTAYLITGDSL